MKKQVLRISCAIILLCIVIVLSGFCWGSAAHAYIGDKLGSKWGLINASRRHLPSDSSLIMASGTLPLRPTEETAVQLLAEQFTTMAGSFLGMIGTPLPDNVALPPLALFCIEQGMLICRDDSAQEIGATVRFVRKNLIQQGITR